MQTRPPKLELVPLDVRAEDGQTEGLTFDLPLMQGRELGAVLFELDVTEATPDLGSELVTNGSFTGNADGWTLDEEATYNANAVDIVADGVISQDGLGLVEGTAYQVSFTLKNASSGNMVISLGGTDFVSSDTDMTDGEYSFQVEPGAGNGIIFSSAETGTPFAGTIDNVSVKELVEAAELDVLLQQTLNGSDYIDVFNFPTVTNSDDGNLPKRVLLPFQPNSINIEQAFNGIGDETIVSATTGLPLLSPDIRLKWHIEGSFAFKVSAYLIPPSSGTHVRFED